MNCIQCNRPFTNDDRIASISGSIMGDEYTDSYYQCPVCRVYSIASWRDNFTGIESMDLSGPIAEQKGNQRVDLIRKCSRPWDKKCRCDAHLEYFNYTLD